MLVRVLLVLYALLASGCATVMDARYSSQVDPEFPFSGKLVIAVLPAEGENTNPLETKYYIDHVVRALKHRGFSSVLSQRDVSNATQPIDVVVLVNISKESDSYQYQGANYGLVDSGRSTVTCNDYGYSVNCTEYEQKMFGVTGYSTKTGYLTGYYFALNWFDMRTKDKIMFVFGSSFEEGCSDRGVYEFLISQTINRLDFKRPNEYKYSVTMPPEYNCKY